jgi:hypothetical protein
VGGEASLTRRDQFTTYTLGYLRTSSTASGIDPNPVIAQLAFASLSTALGEKLTGRLSANYAWNDSLSDNSVDTTSYHVSAELGYAITLWLQAGLSASHFAQDSATATAGSYERNLVSASLTATWR